MSLTAFTINEQKIETASRRGDRVAVFVDGPVNLRVMVLNRQNLAVRDSGLCRFDEVAEKLELVGVYERQPGMTVGDLAELIREDCRYLGVLQ